MKKKPQVDRVLSLAQVETPLPKLAYSPDEIPEVVPFSRSKTFEAMDSGALPARKFGARTIILATDLIKFLESLPLREAKDEA